MVLLFYALAKSAISMGYFKGKKERDRKNSYKNTNILKEHNTGHTLTVFKCGDFLSFFSLHHIGSSHYIERI